MAFSASTPFPYRITPLTNIVPFTYRDGMTYLETLEKMRVWLNNSLVPEFNVGIDNAITEFQKGIDNAEKRVVESENAHRILVRDTLATVETRIGVTLEYVDDVIQLVNNKTGPMDIQRVTLTRDYVVTINPLWPNNHPVRFSLTQGGSGNHKISFADNIKGGLHFVNSSAGGVTEFTVTPDGTGKWYVTQVTDPLKFQKYGTSFSTGDRGWSPTSERLSEIVSETVAFGRVPVSLYLHVAYDSAGVLRVAQHGFNDTGHSVAKVRQAIDELQAAGFVFHDIKLHPQGTGTQLSNAQLTPQYWADYKALVIQVAEMYRGLAPNFYVTNEFNVATGNEAHAPYLRDIINMVQQRGFKAGMTFAGALDMARCKVLPELDLYGINIYPPIGTNGTKTTDAEVMSAWENTGIIQFIRTIKNRYPNKPVYISETGATDNTTALEDPGAPQAWLSNGGNDGLITGRFWSGTLKFFKKYENEIDGLFGWDGGSFSPMQYPWSNDIMKALVEVGK